MAGDYRFWRSTDFLFELACESSFFPSIHFGPQSVPLFPFRNSGSRIQHEVHTLLPWTPAPPSRLGVYRSPSSLSLFFFIDQIAVRLDLLEAELLLSVQSDSYGLSSVGHGKGTFGGSGLQKSQKNHRPWRKGTAEGKVLAALFLPFELRLLYEKHVGDIPSGDLDGIGIANQTLFGQQHREPPQEEIADILPTDFGQVNERRVFSRVRTF